MSQPLFEYDVHYRLDERMFTLKVYAADIKQALQLCKNSYPDSTPVAANLRTGTM